MSIVSALPEVERWCGHREPGKTRPCRGPQQLSHAQMVILKGIWLPFLSYSWGDALPYLSPISLKVGIQLAPYL